METTTIVCDTCGRDLSTTENCEDYRLALVVESIPARSQVVTLMAIPQPIDRTRHYCGVRCLKMDSKLK